MYVKFKKEEDAEKAVNDLNNRWFGGRWEVVFFAIIIKIIPSGMHHDNIPRRPVYAELTPVTDFREACCRQVSAHVCTQFIIFKT